MVALWFTIANNIFVNNKGEEVLLFEKHCCVCRSDSFHIVSTVTFSYYYGRFMYLIFGLIVTDDTPL